MSYTKQQYSAYGMANETVSKAKQLLMLYDGAINFTRKARTALEEKNIEARFNNLQRACQIILGLQSSLDFENGARIAVILSGFYTNIDIRLMAINQSNSIKDCDEIIEDLKRMRASWEEVGSKAASESEGNVAITPAIPENPGASPESVAVSI